MIHIFRLDIINLCDIGKFQIRTVGETWGATPDIAKLYSDPKQKELSTEFLLIGAIRSLTSLHFERDRSRHLQKQKPLVEDRGLAVAPNYQTINVKAALADKESIFYTYQKLIAYRKSHEVISIGDYSLLILDTYF